MKKFLFAESVPASRFGRLRDSIANRDQHIAGTKWSNPLPVNHRSAESEHGPVRLKPLHSIFGPQNESRLVPGIHVSKALPLGLMQAQNIVA